MLTQQELKNLMHYNLKTGNFYWLCNKGKKTKNGTPVGTVAPTGYSVIWIDNCLYLAHRLAHLYVEGYFPEYQIDHKDGIKTNNKWTNLRHVTKSCNMQNQKISSKNTSGFPGVTWDRERNKWMSKLKIFGKNIMVGRYESKLEAALARFTLEMQCDKWSCNYRSELAKAIKNAWPEFKFFIDGETN